MRLTILKTANFSTPLSLKWDVRKFLKNPHGNLFLDSHSVLALT